MSDLNWSLKNIPDLTGKTIIVTGGNSGLGFEAVKAYASKNARVIMACRSVSKAEKARETIMNEIPKAEIILMELDLADLQSIRNFTSKFKQNHSHLDILLNNAGIMMPSYGLTKDGFEKQMGTNHLGHFALTGLLLDVLKRTPKSRVVNVSSMAHKSGVMDFENLQFENGNGYSPMKAYGRSKLSNLLFTYELQRFFEKNHIDCNAIAAHPGISVTNLFSSAAPKWLLFIFRPLILVLFQPAKMGVLPELRAAIDPEAKGGEYYGPKGFNEIKGYPVIVQSNKASHNQEDAQKLWKISEKLTGVIFE
jgi:NAD(P)-dependent dehydrogenase (short-subunit alcohol dehydrogenase family)